MPILTSEAFVLRSYKLGESDKIVVLFTRDAGKIRLVAKGARKLKNRFGASLEVFAHVRIAFHDKQNQDLLLLDRAELIYSPFEKQRRLRTSYFLSYFAELVHEFSPERERSPRVFQLLLSIEKGVQNRQDLDFLARYVELQLLHAQGVLSTVISCTHCNRDFHSTLERRYLGAGTEILCGRCRDEESLRLSTGIVRTIETLERGSGNWVSTLPPALMEELGSFNHLLITRYLGKEIQSYQFRKQLGAVYP